MYRRVPGSAYKNEKRFYKDGNSWAQTKELDKNGQMGKDDVTERYYSWKISHNGAAGVQQSSQLRTPHSLGNEFADLSRNRI